MCVEASSQSRGNSRRLAVAMVGIRTVMKWECPLLPRPTPAREEGNSPVPQGFHMQR